MCNHSIAMARPGSGAPRKLWASGKFQDALVIYACLWIYSRKFSVAMVESLIHGLCI